VVTKHQKETNSLNTSITVNYRKNKPDGSISSIQIYGTFVTYVLCRTLQIDNMDTTAGNCAEIFAVVFCQNFLEQHEKNVNCCIQTVE
jgi:hypothetical protein